MNPVTKAFADALAQNAGMVVGVVIAAFVAVIEAARRWAVAKFAQSAVDTHGDEELAAQQVRGLPRALRPLKRKNVEKVVARAMLQRKLRSEDAQVAAMGGLPVDSPQLPVPPPPPVRAALADDEDDRPTHPVPPPGGLV